MNTVAKSGKDVVKNTNSVTAKTWATLARAVGAELDGNEDFASAQEEFADASETVATGPVRFCVLLSQAYGDDVMEKFPRPGSKEGETNGVPEIFRVQETTDKGTKSVQKNWFTEFYPSTPKGKVWTYYSQQIDLALDATTKGQVKHPDVLAHINDRHWLLAQKAKTKSRITRGRASIRTSVALLYKVAELKEYADKVKVEFDTYVDGEGTTQLHSTTYPVILSNPKKTGSFEPLTFNSFLRVNTVKAVKDAGDKGDLYDALIATLSRDKKDGKTELSKKYTINNTDEAEASLAEFGHWSGNKENRAQLLKRMNSKDGEDLIVTVVEHGMDMVELRDMFMNKYTIIMSKRAAAEGAAATKAA